MEIEVRDRAISLADLFAQGRISQSQYNAGYNWQKTYLNYLGCIGAPSPFGAINNYSDDECEIWTERFKRGKDILLKCGRRVFHAVNSIAVYEEPLGDFEYSLKAAKIGLSALSEKF